MITLRSFLCWTAIAWIGISVLAIRTEKYWIFYLLYVWFLAVLIITYVAAGVRDDNRQNILQWTLVIAWIGILIFAFRTDENWLFHSSWLSWLVFSWTMMIFAIIAIDDESCYECSAKDFWQDRVKRQTDPQYWDKRIEREKREEQEKRYKR